MSKPQKPSFLFKKAVSSFNLPIFYNKRLFLYVVLYILFLNIEILNL